MGVFMPARTPKGLLALCDARASVFGYEASTYVSCRWIQCMPHGIWSDRYVQMLVANNSTRNPVLWRSFFGYASLCKHAAALRLNAGSGKTYTMMGSPDNPGVNRRAITGQCAFVAYACCAVVVRHLMHLRLNLLSVYSPLSANCRCGMTACSL